MNNILNDIKLAPLYINDPIMNYPAKWHLTYGDKRSIEEI